MMKNSNWQKFVWGVVGLGMGVAAQAQPGWVFECDTREDPPVSPYSDDWGTIGVANELLSVRMGVSGTVTYGGDGGPCYDPGRTLDAPGRFAIATGSIGSVQTDFDNGLAWTMGAPADAAGDFCYARIIKGDGNDSALFGDGGLRGAFTGASRRYFVGLWNDADIDVRLTVRVIGDAGRFQWDIRNLQTETQTIGLRFGACAGMRTVVPNVTEPGSAYNQANSVLGTFSGVAKGRDPQPGYDLSYIGFTYLPTTKPVRNERNYLSDNIRFPEVVKFEFGQSVPYGLRLTNVSTDALEDQTPADQFIIGNYGSFTQPGLIWNNTMRTRVFLDAGPDPVITNIPPAAEEADINLNEAAFIQTFKGQNVPAGGTRTIINYVLSTWSNGDYLDPYSVVVDAPTLVATDPNSNDLSPNPFPIRAYIDNQYSTLDREVTLNDVRVTLTLPPGLTRVGGEPQTKILPRVAPNEIAFVEWQVVADPEVFGNLPYEVKYEAVPGPVKTIKGNIPIASTPRVFLGEGPNLVTIPWNFPDTSLDTILAPLLLGQDYLAYQWDPELAGYVPVTSATRATGLWIVPVSDQGYKVLNTPSRPSDTAVGGKITNLSFGWNLIGNPYNYPIRLSTLVAVAQDNPQDSFTWSDLITLGFVTPALAYWQRDANDPNIGQYRYTEGENAFLQPNTGYWIYVSTIRPIRLVWPGVFTEGMPDSGRAVESEWKQTDKQWRLQLSAQTAEAVDSQNYVGVVPTAKDVNRLRLPKPPTPPQGRNTVGTVEVMVEDNVAGKKLMMSRTFADKLERREWRVFVRTNKAGDVTLTWPNASSVPKNVRFRLVDKATGTTRDLRAASGYTFNMSEAGTREFALQIEPGGASRAVIGNVVVTRPTRDPAAPFTINYSLSADATTSIRILSGTGKEVFTITRGRADSTGENSATWAMRDNANRAVPPGSYRVEILAETTNGERVRKIVPVNVVR